MSSGYSGAAEQYKGSELHREWPMLSWAGHHGRSRLPSCSSLSSGRPQEAMTRRSTVSKSRVVAANHRLITLTRRRCDHYGCPEFVSIHRFLSLNGKKITFQTIGNPRVDRPSLSPPLRPFYGETQARLKGHSSLMAITEGP